MKLHILKLPVIAFAFLLTACAIETGDTRTKTSEETELSSDIVMTTDTEFAETTTSERMSRIEELVRTAGYDEGEPKLSDEPEVTFQYSDEDYDYYRFYYDGMKFEVLQEYDNWKIFDSCKIRNSKDMQLICSALINIYPVHGADLKSYRTPEDMAYEWIEHNIVYGMPMADDSMKENAASVDLDAKDQNKTLLEILQDRKDTDSDGKER